MKLISTAQDPGFPARAECAKGPQFWTMSHPRNGRFELRFGLRTPNPAQRLGANLCWLVFAACYFSLMREIYRLTGGNDKLNLFAGLTLFAMGIVTVFHPRLGMRVQELVIDQKSKSITATGLVLRRRVTIVQDIDQVSWVEYKPGTERTATSIEKTARLTIHFTEPGKDILLDRLGVLEPRLHTWLQVMVGHESYLDS